jgi:hypothetical protein
MKKTKTQPSKETAKEEVQAKKPKKIRNHQHLLTVKHLERLKSDGKAKEEKGMTI